MSNDAALIAAFLAKKSVTKIETGVRTMTEKQMYAATGYERETQKVFFATGWDECGMPKTHRITADSLSDAEKKVSENYPEFSIHNVTRDNPADSLHRLENIR